MTLHGGGGGGAEGGNEINHRKSFLTLIREVSVGTRNIAVSSFFWFFFSFVFADFQLTAACTAHQTSDFGETCIPLRSQLYARRGAKAAIATAPKCTLPVSRHHVIWVDYASVVP